MTGHGPANAQHIGPVAQGIERRFPKPCVAGSNPTGATCAFRIGLPARVVGLAAFESMSRLVPHQSSHLCDGEAACQLSLSSMMNAGIDILGPPGPLAPAILTLSVE